MKQVLLWVVNIISLMMTLFFGFLWISRTGLKYNSAGTCLAEDEAVVYDTDALITYGALAILFGLIGVISWTITWRRKKMLNDL